ncbi:hypothetical protein D3C87_2085000 [compost metagenome]
MFQAGIHVAHIDVVSCEEAVGSVAGEVEDHAVIGARLSEESLHLTNNLRFTRLIVDK